MTQAIPTLRTDLRDMPEHMIKCLGLAQHQVLTQCMEQEALILQQQSAEVQQEVDMPSFGVHMPLINARYGVFPRIFFFWGGVLICCGRHLAVMCKGELLYRYLRIFS